MTECEAIVSRLVDRAPDEIQRWLDTSDVYEGWRCVFVARVGFNVLARLGIASEPIYAIAEVWNTAYARWRERPGATQEEFDRDKCWLVTNDPHLVRDANVGRRELSPEHTEEEIADCWRTHLLLNLQQTGQVIDLGLGVLARPARGLRPPAAIALPWDGSRAEHTWASWGTLRYRSWPTSDIPCEDYRSTECWRDGDFGKYKYLEKRIVRAIQARRSPWRPL